MTKIDPEHVKQIEELLDNLIYVNISKSMGHVTALNLLDCDEKKRPYIQKYLEDRNSFEIILSYYEYLKSLQTPKICECGD